MASCEINASDQKIKKTYFFFAGEGKQAEARIFRGQEAIPHTIPYHVGLSSSPFINEAICGGALITPNYVLTGN